MNPTDESSEIDAEPPWTCMIGNRVVHDRLFHRVSRELMFARVRAGLLQRQVAMRMGTTTSVVSRMENARGHRPTLTTLDEYAQAVRCMLRIRLVDRNEAWYRELAAIAGQRVAQPDKLRD